MKKACLAVGTVILTTIVFAFSTLSAKPLDSKTFVEISQIPLPTVGQLEMVLIPKENLEPKRLSKQDTQEENDKYRDNRDWNQLLDTLGGNTSEDSSLKSIREKLKYLQKQSRQNNKDINKKIKKPKESEDSFRPVKLYGLGNCLLIDEKGLFLSPSYKNLISKFVAGEEYNISSFRVVVNGRAYPAEFISMEGELALWQIKKLENTQWKPAMLPQNTQTQLGQIVAIVGKEKRGRFVKIGHISSKSKNFICVSSYGWEYDTYGALVFNLQKEIIGMATGGNDFIEIIPINQSIIAELIKSSKKKTGSQKSWIGVELLELSKEAAEYLRGFDFNIRQEKGLAVRSYPLLGSPANEAGLEEGDIIKSINGQEVKKLEDARKLIEGTPPGKILTMEIIDEETGETRTLKIKPIKKKFYHNFLVSPRVFFGGKIY